MYKRLCKSLNDKGQLIPEAAEPFDYIDDTDRDWYLSTYLYNEEQYKEYEETGTIKGITEVVTDKLWFDFDSEAEPELARENAVTICDRLMNLGIEQEDIVIAFSGNKGFAVEVTTNQKFNPKQAKELAVNLAGDLPTFDIKMYNAARIFRVMGTKHPKTGLYKIPLTFNQLNELDIDQIFDLAKQVPMDAEFRWNVVDLPVNLIKKETKPKERMKLVEELPLPGLDWAGKPKFLTNCRWALQNGFFKDGERSTALLCLAATYKNLGFDQEHVYRMLKGVATLQGKRNETDRFPDEEIWNNIILQVFTEGWKNGQYTCREEGSWLHDYCQALGDKKCDHKADEDAKPKTLVQIRDSFKEYVKKIDENTIITGIPSIDKNVFISTGANVGIIGAAGSGKSSIALEILNNTSKQGVKSVFASLDMHRNRMFEKVMYKISGLDRDSLYNTFAMDEEGPIMDKLQEEFGNVFFYNRSCPTVADIKDYVLRCQDDTGEKIKFVMLDYFERVSSDMSDDTAASKRVAGELQDLVNDLDIALITLVQPHKNALSGGVDQPIYDYTKIKGSSYVYQAFRIIMSLWRPFYNPKDFSHDHFMQMAVLKNDLGELKEFAFGWNGKRSSIRELEDHEFAELKELLAQKGDPQGSPF